MTNTILFYLSGYAVHWVVQRMYNNVAAIPLYIPNKNYCLAFLFFRFIKYKHWTGRAYLKCTSCAEEFPFSFTPEWQRVLLDTVVNLQFS
jgi:hypothetical protein